MFNLKKSIIEISVKGDQNLFTKQPIEGYQFEYEGFSFNVHKSHKNNGTWAVSDYITGMAVCAGKTSRKAALISFKIIFDKFGKEKIQEIINRNIEVLKQGKFDI